MGISAQQILGNDPEYLSRQLRQQQLQDYMAPFTTSQERGAAQLGGILGGGIANLFGGRGFFDVTDPALQRVSDVNRLISEGLKDIDPTDPEAMATAYGNIAKQLASAGYAQPAALAAGEAAKMKAAIGAGFKESTVYMNKDGSALTVKNGKYYDVEGNQVGKNDMKLIPKDSLGRVISTVTADGKAGAGGETDQEKAKRIVEERRKKAEEDARRAGRDPYFDPMPGDSAEVLAEKAQRRLKRDRERALQSSEMGGIGSETVAP